MLETPSRIELLRPDDWHLHLRDGPALTAVLPHTARRFGRAIVMPNLRPPVTRLNDARAYRQRIMQALPVGSRFEPLMTLYLTDNTPADEIEAAADGDLIRAVKLYPAGATTNSDAGVTRLARVYPLLEIMQRRDLPLLIHAEVTDDAVDIFDREQVFIERHLRRLLEDFPRLRIVFEHITTEQAVDFVVSARDGVGATITAHHLLYNRNALLAGGVRPHFYCLPVLKRERHRRALVRAATSGNPRFFLGTDSAPHGLGAKETACGCAGSYTAHAAIELYAEVFDAAGALDRLEGFASRHGPAFYRLPCNTERIVLERSEWRVPQSYAFGEQRLVPLRAGEVVRWRLVDPVA